MPMTQMSTVIGEFSYYFFCMVLHDTYLLKAGLILQMEHENCLETKFCKDYKNGTIPLLHQKQKE